MSEPHMSHAVCVLISIGSLDSIVLPCLLHGGTGHWLFIYDTLIIINMIYLFDDNDHCAT